MEEIQRFINVLPANYVMDIWLIQGYSLLRIKLKNNDEEYG